MQASLKKLHQSPKIDLRIIHAGSYQAAKGVHFPPHRHSFWELVYYRSGTVGCVMEGRQHPGHVGLLWLTPPNVIHAEQALTAYSNYFLALEIQNKKMPIFLEDDADRSLGRVCQQIVCESTRKSPEQPRLLELLAAQLDCLLNRTAREQVLSHPAQTVARAERLMEEKSAHSLTVQEVAADLNVSLSALRGYFQAVRGCSPRAHLQQVRLEKAIRFLRTSTLKLEAIAELCGYDSASHLTRSVKKFTSKTPGQLRHSARFPHPSSDA